MKKKFICFFYDYDHLFLCQCTFFLTNKLKEKCFTWCYRLPVHICGLCQLNVQTATPLKAVLHEHNNEIQIILRFPFGLFWPCWLRSRWGGYLVRVRLTPGFKCAWWQEVQQICAHSARANLYIECAKQEGESRHCESEEIGRVCA